MKLTVKFGQAQEETVEVDPSVTVLALKEQLVEKFTIPVAQQRVIFAGRILKDAQTLESYGLNKEGLAIHLVKGSAVVAQPQPPPPQPAAPATATAPFGGAFPIPTAAGGAAQLSMQQMMAQMQSNPEFARQLMDNPMVQSVMSNPELMRSMLMQNPSIRQLVENNPELNHVLSDPQLLRQSLEMARNPELMREALRNTDRAMSNIEALPGGQEALRRFFTDVQAPLMDAAVRPPDAAAAQATTTPVATTPASPNPNTQPLPNPWAPQQTTAAPHAAPSVSPAGGAPSPLGAGFPSMFGGMPAGMPDTQTLMQMMQDPTTQQMMQQMASNPQFMQQMMEMSPYGRQMLESNPGMRQMLQDPAFLQQLANPQTIQAALQLQQSFGGGGMPGLGAFGLPTPPSATGNSNAGTFASMPPFGMPLSQAPAALPPPEVRFANQIHQLEEMGFTDIQQNITALTATNGNVQYAIERILGGH